MLDAQTLADRYVDVWNERDDESRRVAIAALWVPDGQHYVEGREARGYEALEKRMGRHCLFADVRCFLLLTVGFAVSFAVN